jgi:hypothetical protein
VVLPTVQENIGRDDMPRLPGRRVRQFKYRLCDWLRHATVRAGRRPHAVRIRPEQSDLRPTPAARANSNVPPWTSFDFRTFRKDTGGNFEFSGGSPWYVRLDANEVRQTGINKADSAALGTSPGNGFIDLPYPVDWVTRSVVAEAGYQAPRGHFSVNWTQSKFQNENVLLNFQNSFFGNGMDTATFAPDNDYMRIGLSGVLRQLPMSSSLSGRLAYSKATNSTNMLGAVLNTAGSATPVATNPTSSTFDQGQAGRFKLSSLPMRNLDTRLLQLLQAENDSARSFRPHGRALLLHGGNDRAGQRNVFCSDDQQATKHNPGFELGCRLSQRTG